MKLRIWDRWLLFYSSLNNFCGADKYGVVWAGFGKVRTPFFRLWTRGGSCNDENESECDGGGAL
jgi:hypothetical protein